MPMGTLFSWQEAVEQYKKGALWLTKKVIEACLDDRDPSTCGSVSFASCFPPGTEVEIEGNEYCKIEEIKVGSSVLTHQGGINKVSRVISRPYKGSLIRILASRYGVPLECTPEHPLLAVKGNIRERGKARELNGELEFIPAKNLREGDFIAITLPKVEDDVCRDGNLILVVKSLTTRELVEENGRVRLPYGRSTASIPSRMEFDQELASLFGWYLAEGSISLSEGKRSRLNFHLGSHEETIAKWIVEVVKRRFGVKGSLSYLRESNLRVSFSSGPLAELFYALGSTGSGSKRILPILFNSSSPVKLELLRGWLLGDGSIRKRTTTSITGSTISRTLAKQLYRILLQEGFSPRLHIRKAFVGGKGVNHSTSYHFAISGPQASKIFSGVGGSNHLRRSYQVDGQFLVPIRKISSSQFEGNVYDLTIPGPESYVAEGFSVHNCTGYECPSIVHWLAKDLGFAPDTCYASILGMGCEGGFPALRRAYDYVVAHNKPALAVSCEICSVDFFPEDGAHPDVTNDYELLRANAIFGDGASAVLLGFDDDWRHPYLLDFESYFDPNNMHHLGFTWEDGRLRVLLSKLVPKIAPLGAKVVIDKILQRNRLSIDDIQWWVIHPGGRAVLDNIRDLIGLPEEKLSLSREALATYGNCSSSSIGIVGKLLMGKEIKPNDYIIVVSIGAGLAAGATLLRFGGG